MSEDCFNCEEEFKEYKLKKCNRCDNKICRECIGMSICQQCFKDFCNSHLGQCDYCLENFCEKCLSEHMKTCYNDLNHFEILKDKFREVIDTSIDKSQLFEGLLEIINLEGSRS